MSQSEVFWQVLVIGFHAGLILRPTDEQLARIQELEVQLHRVWPVFGEFNTAVPTLSPAFSQSSLEEG